MIKKRQCNELLDLLRDNVIAEKEEKDNRSDLEGIKKTATSIKIT